MTRRKPRANRRQGLWQDTAEQPYVPAHDLRIEQETSPLLRECPACHAAPRQACTRPGRGGRKPLRDRNHQVTYHPSRLEAGTQPVGYGHLSASSDRPEETP